jgi:hypothetical protein
MTTQFIHLMTFESLKKYFSGFSSKHISFPTQTLCVNFDLEIFQKNFSKLIVIIQIIINQLHHSILSTFNTKHSN